MARFIYVDNSNLFLEARKLATVQKGFVGSVREANAVHAFDNTYRLDYFKLLEFLAATDKISRAVVFGSSATPESPVWTHAEEAGWEVFSFERNFKNREKKIDIAVATEMLVDAFKWADKEMDRIVLVAGDSDYVPTIYRLREEGFVVLVYFWGHAAGELKQIATEYVNMDSWLADLELL